MYAEQRKLVDVEQGVQCRSGSGRDGPGSALYRSISRSTLRLGGCWMIKQCKSAVDPRTKAASNACHKLVGGSNRWALGVLGIAGGARGGAGEVLWQARDHGSGEQGRDHMLINGTAPSTQCTLL